MVDPVANEGLSKVAEQAGVDDPEQTGGIGGDGRDDQMSFQEVMEETSGGDREPNRAETVDGVDELEQVEMQEAEGVDDVRSASAPDQGRQVQLREFVEGISQKKSEIDEMMERTMNGADLDQQELLEMQTLIYSYSRQVEMTSKVVEKATGGLKQMMQVRV